MFLQTEALVVKTVDFSESSLVLTLFSRDFGKIRTIAKGGRRIKGPFESALDLMAHILVTYIAKRGDVLDLLAESKLVRRFRPTQENYGGMYAGYYLIELLNEMTIEQEPMPELFDAAVETLSQLMTGKSILPSIMRFEWQLLELTGHFPSLDFCVQCDAEIDHTARRIAFGHLDGGVVCPNCRPRTQQVSIIKPELLAAIKQLSAGSGLSAVTDRCQGQMRVLLNQYISHLIGKRPVMFDYFETMWNP
ncbi:MAG: DNA repair protein RecO [Planctomycetaceae bacterium]|nr:DNA repair protein RecO [Planctomycetaceae bacterium]